MIRLWSADAPLAWSELELLEAEDAVAERPAQPVGRARADRAETDDDGVPVATGTAARRLSARGRLEGSQEREPLDARATVIASVIRPSRVIASASSNGTQRTLELPPCRRVSASPWVRPVARNRMASSSLTRFERWRRASSRQSVGLDAGLLAQLAPGAVERRLPGGHAAFGDLPRIRVERVAVLADEERRDRRRRWPTTPAARLAKWTTP